ncbi:MAG TPA: hypothetical protein VGR70_01830 [Stellaceae bacterium]|nr:hypothetical protein [Stellaceae bacterium]
MLPSYVIRVDCTDYDGRKIASLHVGAETETAARKLADDQRRHYVELFPGCYYFLNLVGTYEQPFRGEATEIVVEQRQFEPQHQQQARTTEQVRTELNREILEHLAWKASQADPHDRDSKTVIIPLSLCRQAALALRLLFDVTMPAEPPQPVLPAFRFLGELR